MNYPKAALNSAIITVCAVVLTLLTNTFVAYAVARNMDKRFFRFLYYFFLAMMFVPFTVIMLPIAKEMGSLHLDNQLGLIILYTILGIGTNLVNDLGIPALQNVIKLIRCNDQPVAKLSDDPIKSMCEDESYLRYLKAF